MQDNSTVAVSVDGTTRNRHSDGPVWFSTVYVSVDGTTRNRHSDGPVW